MSEDQEAVHLDILCAFTCLHVYCGIMYTMHVDTQENFLIRSDGCFSVPSCLIFIFLYCFFSTSL